MTKDKPIGTCKNCTFQHLENLAGQLVMVCRRNPPTVTPLVIMTPKGPQVAGLWAGWPPIEKPDEDYCHEFDVIPATARIPSIVSIGSRKDQ